MELRKDDLFVMKPCGILGYCPYGDLVELSPVTQVVGGGSCSEIDHECPVFDHADCRVDPAAPKSGDVRLAGRIVDPTAPKREDLDDEIEDDS